MPLLLQCVFTLLDRCLDGQEWVVMFPCLHQCKPMVILLFNRTVFGDYALKQICLQSYNLCVHKSGCQTLNTKDSGVH